jgi:Phage integrase central domain
MTSNRRAHGDGGIYEQGKHSFRLRYRINGKRFSKTVCGTLSEAKKELRALLRSGDTGEHVAPDKATLATWARQWIEAGCPGRKRQAVGARAIERYDQLLRVHVLPTLGERKLQHIHSTDIDKLYLSLEGKIAPRTARHVHSVLNACLGAAVRTKKLAINPMESTTKVPSPGESDHGIALDDEQLKTLVQGFKGSALFGMSALPHSLAPAEMKSLRCAGLISIRKRKNLELSVRSKKRLLTASASRAPKKRATSAPSPSTTNCLHCS